MVDKLIELVKNPGQENQRITVAKIIKEKDMGVGGATGPKTITNLEVSHKNRSHSLSLISKNTIDGRLNTYEIINAHNVARRDGFRVPQTTRYLKNEKGNSMVMSDMTEGGKYIVWGFNDEPTHKEAKAFKKLNLTETDKVKINDQGNEIVNLANKKGRSVSFYNYHIRRNIKTKEIEIFLLDLSPYFILKTKNPNENKKEFETFFRLLSLKPKEHERSLNPNPDW